MLHKQNLLQKHMPLVLYIMIARTWCVHNLIPVLIGYKETFASVTPQEE